MEYNNLEDIFNAAEIKSLKAVADAYYQVIFSINNDCTKLANLANVMETKAYIWGEENVELSRLYAEYKLYTDKFVHDNLSEEDITKYISMTL